MKVKLLISRVCSKAGSQSPGDVVEVSAAEGARMIAAGQCVAVDVQAPKRDSAAGVDVVVTAAPAELGGAPAPAAPAVAGKPPAKKSGSKSTAKK